MANELETLKALRAQIRKYEDTLDHYERLFNEDGTIDAYERKQLDSLRSKIDLVNKTIQQKEEKLGFFEGVQNSFSKGTEAVSDSMSKTDDIVDHSLVEPRPQDDKTNETPPKEDEPSTPAPTGVEKYKAIAETEAVKAFLKEIHNSEGGYVDDPNDPGGKTKYGIAEHREWPAFAKMHGLDPNKPELIKDITKEQVDLYYIKSRFEQNGLDKIKSAKVINAIFDQSVLTPSLVRKNIKRGLNALDSANKFPENNKEFTADEIKAINAANADKLVAKFVEYQNAYYEGLAKDNPAKFKRYLDGWKNRTARLAGFKVDKSAGSDDTNSNSSVGSEGGNTFKVPKGWGMDKIAKEHGVTVEQLKAWNADKLKTYKGGGQGFNAGETIIIKDGSTSGSGGETTFKVPKGWGLERIAKEHGVTVEQLKAWNADKLKTYKGGSQGFNVGETIVIKGGSSSSGSTGTDNKDSKDDSPTKTKEGYLEPAWIKEARKYIGKKETAKYVKDDPWVKLLFESLGAYGWAKDKTVQTANWCAAFVSYCLKNTGQSSLSGFDGMRAKTYGKKYGTQITRPVYGALAIVERDGGGHIGFVVGYDKKTKVIKMLGGNQSNAVNIKDEKRTLVAYRVPSSWKIPEQNYLD